MNGEKKMKKAVAIIAALAAGVLALTARADTWTDPATGIEWSYYVNDNGEAVLGDRMGRMYPSCFGGNSAGELAIPESVNGVSVAEIGRWAFYRCYIDILRIPNCVKRIGYGAFEDAEINAVDVDDVETWCNFKFESAASNPLFGGNGHRGQLFVDGEILSDLVIPATVTNISDYAFLCLDQLRSVSIPSSVKAIGQEAIGDCHNVDSLVLEEGIEYIGNRAFIYCTNLTSVVIPASVLKIDESAFAACSKLSQLKISSDCVYISSSAFHNCSRLSDVYINIKDMGKWCTNAINAHLSGRRHLMVLGDEITELVIPDDVTNIGSFAFSYCNGLTSVAIPNSVTSIGSSAFYGCSGLTRVTIPDSVARIGSSAFSNCVLMFGGEVPSGVSQLANSCYFAYPMWQEDLWRSLLRKSPSVKIISSTIRDSDPTILDTRFMVMKSGPIETPPTVRIRALAFEDGERSFAKVVRPETFVDGTAPANWDAVEANVEHTLSWKVSSDWATRLAKVQFEILVCEDDLLPLELRTIPASDQYGKMKISWNAITESQVFDALLWLYADKDPGLTLAGGVLRNGSTQLASGTGLSSIFVDHQYTYPAPEYIYSKMGYQLLTGAPLSYANSETRLGLSPSGARQYGYKIVEE